MFRQYMTQESTSPSSESTPRRLSPLWKAIIGAAGVAVIMAMMPVLLPGVAASLSGTAPQAYWFISRASAFVAFGLIWLSMLAGLGITSKLGRFWPGMPGSFELHRFTALLGIGFGAVHALVLLGDKYMNYTLGQLLVPFMGGSYRPEWVGFGQLSFYTLLVVAFSFYVRDRLKTHTWRMIHMLSFALFLMVLIHGLNSGTDSASVWAQALYWTSAVSVALGSVYRVFAARLGRPKAAPSARKLVALAGRSQAVPGGEAVVSRG